MNNILPAVDMPCTIGIGSDRYAACVSAVFSAKNIGISRITAHGIGHEEKWSLRKDGHWRPKGSGKNCGYYLVLGVAENYRDPSF
jgi:hypothetical protein